MHPRATLDTQNKLPRERAKKLQESLDRRRLSLLYLGQLQVLEESRVHFPHFWPADLSASLQRPRYFATRPQTRVVWRVVDVAYIDREPCPESSVAQHSHSHFLH